MSLARLVLSDDGRTQVHEVGGVPVLHEGRPMVRVLRDGRVEPAPLEEVVEAVGLVGGGQVLAVRTGEASNTGTAPVAEEVRVWQERCRRAEAGKAHADDLAAQRLAQVQAAEAEARAVGAVLVQVPVGRELVPIATEDAPPNPVLEALRGVGLGATVAATWLCGGVLSLTPWWEAAWWACKAVTVALCVGWVAYRAGKGWRSARAWVPVIEDGKYTARVQREGRSEVLCRRDGRAGWRDLAEFVARPAWPAPPPAQAVREADEAAQELVAAAARARATRAAARRTAQGDDSD